MLIFSIYHFSPSILDNITYPYLKKTIPGRLLSVLYLTRKIIPQHRQSCSKIDISLVQEFFGYSFKKQNLHFNF